MGNDFAEKAHLNVDKEKYDEGYARIFGDKCPECTEMRTLVKYRNRTLCQDCHNYFDEKNWDEQKQESI